MSMYGLWNHINEESLGRKEIKEEKKMERHKVTIGIPAYKAQDHICDALASIQIQTFKDIEVIIATDLQGEDYNFVLDRFPDLDITILPCEKNTGPGLARQRALDACNTEWITFMDADDVFISPMAIEDLLTGATAAENIIECQGAFYEELMEPVENQKLLLRDEATQPWVFARLYNVKFLRDNHIEFSDLRAMEDAEFNWKIRMAIGGKDLFINKIDKPIYFWRKGSEHSITRVLLEGTNIPQYTYDLAVYGTAKAAGRAIEYANKYNPANKEIRLFALDIMLSLYFTLMECEARGAGIFWDQVMFISAKYYQDIFSKYEYSDDEIKTAYSVKNASKANKLLGVMPHITFYSFLNAISKEHTGHDDWDFIRKQLPKSVIENDKRTGVLE